MLRFVFPNACERMSEELIKPQYAKAKEELDKLNAPPGRTA